MANILTGDFDVVAQFTVPAVNRILAAMHQCERFLHSVSGFIDDTQPPHGPDRFHPTLTGGRDRFGDPIVNPRQISARPQLTAALAAAAAAPALSRFGDIVNPNLGGVLDVGKVEPSNIKGRVQLQLSAPTVDVPDTTGKNLSVTINAMARYFPEKNTAPLAEFIRGDLRMTAAVSQVASEVGNVVEFDLKADQVGIAFTPTSSSKPLSAADLAGIRGAIRNALKTSFLPSSATLPSNIAGVQFKTLKTGSQKAVAVMLNLSSHGANAASANKMLPGPNDHFAFAAGRDFVLSQLQKIADNLLSQPLPPVGFTKSLVVTSIHFKIPIRLRSATFDLKAGKIVLTVKGHASRSNHPHILGAFDFTATLDFTLQAIGPSVNLIPGGVSFDSTSTLADLADFFFGSARTNIANARDQALSDSNAFGLVSDMFDMNQRLGPFMNSLLKPADSNDPPPLQGFLMTYSGIDIQPAGIVLHGLLFCIFQLPGPHVEFEQIPSQSGGGGPLGGVGGPGGEVNQGPDYSAFKSWIPGGKIDQYEWSVSIQNKLYPFGVDPNKFMLVHSGPVASDGSDGGSLPPFTRLCLTVRGTQLSPQGPIVPQAVSGTVCAFTTMPVLASGVLKALQDGSLPALALSNPGPGGQLIVSGHVSAEEVKPGTGAPNLFVHFGNAKSSVQLPALTRSLRSGKRNDTAAAVLAIVPPGDLAKLRHTPGVIYAEDTDGAWSRLLGVKEKTRPITLMLDPSGKVAWSHKGAVDHDTVTAACKEFLVPTAPPRVTVPVLNARIGHAAPNFLFEFARGSALTLSKLQGKAVMLVFWRSNSQPSLEAIRELRNGDGKAAKTIVLAINDGESSTAARRALKQAKLSATLVADPKREISSGYGIRMWPTIISIDASGQIDGIRYGHSAATARKSKVKRATAKTRSAKRGR
jgi:peroxiredoxin